MLRRYPLRLAMIGGAVVFVGLAVFAYPRIQRDRRLAAIESALAEHDLATALERLESHLALEPDDRDTRLLAARTARRLDDFTAADRHLEQFERAGGSRDEVFLERTMRQSQLGQLGGGTGTLRFCAQNPDNPATPLMLEALVRGSLVRGQPTLALEAADAWLERDPQHGERAYALFLRSRAQERTGNVPAAIAGYRQSLTVNPRSHECRLALAEILAREAPAEALPLFNDLSASGYRPDAVRLGRAGCLRQLGDADRAAEEIAPLLRNETVGPAVLVEAARIALDRGRPRDAEPLLARVLERTPANRDALVQMARCLRELGRDAEARERLEQLRKLDDALFHKLQSGGMQP